MSSPTMAGNKKRVLVPAGKPEPKDENSYVTPRGHDITIENDSFGMYRVHFPGGGPLPRELQGRFTERWRAELAIERYLKDYWKGRT